MTNPADTVRGQKVAAFFAKDCNLYSPTGVCFTMFDEKEVISRILSGDATAFASLVKQYEALVYHMVNRLVDDKASTDDVCQEVFISVYKGLRSFGHQSKLSTWIARIAYHASVNHLRKQKKGRMAARPEELEQHFFTHDTPQEEASRKDVSAYLHRLIAQLPAQYKTVLTLYHLNEFSYVEIEEITGMPEGTVKSYLFRARKLLKEKLEAHLKNEVI